MSDKDNKRLMQYLLIACAFVLVLLYLYFTKGACWEMKGTFATIAKVALIGASSLPTLCVLFLIGYSILNSDKTNNKKTATTIFCCENKSVFYFTEDCSQIPSTDEKVVVRNVDDLEKINNEKKTIKDVYILNPSGKVTAKKLEKLGNAKIHFCKVGKTFCIEKIIKNKNGE